MDGPSKLYELTILGLFKANSSKAGSISSLLIGKIKWFHMPTRFEFHKDCFLRHLIWRDSWLPHDHFYTFGKQVGDFGFNDCLARL